jgi:hypothetical protein
LLGPDFRKKAGRVIDLYEGHWQGLPLRNDEFVISTDEKTSIQARRPIHPPLPPAPHRSMRTEHEYERMGAWAYPTLDALEERLHGFARYEQIAKPFEWKFTRKDLDAASIAPASSKHPSGSPHRIRE